MSGVTQKIVEPADDDVRLDRWFKRHYPHLGFGQLSKLLRTGQIRLDGKRAKPGDRVVKGQTIRVPPLPETPAPASSSTPIRAEDGEALRAMILHKDKHLIVLNKAPGLAVQGGSGQTRHIDGLLDALQFDASERPKLVHRLDKDTSGLLVLARSAKAAATLAKSFQARDAHKVYWAMVAGMPKQAQGRITSRLDKRPGRGGEKMQTTEDGKPAMTLYHVLDRAARKASWVALKPVTGRTHQLRVHMAELGCPIVGDGKYGGTVAHLGGAVSRKLHLHARHLRLRHPGGGVLDMTAPLPGHMIASWGLFGWEPEDVIDPFLDELP